MSTKSGFPGSESDADDQPTDVYPTLAGPPTFNDPSAPAAMASGPAPASSAPSLLSAAQSDRCNNCGSQLAPDQRYCVVCGERRGRARFASAMFSDGPEAADEPAPVFVAQPGRSSRYPSAATLIAGVATLLVAMALGILIGHDSSNKTQVSAQTPPHYTFNVNAGGSGLGTSAGSSGSSTSAGSSSTTGSASKSSGKSSSKSSKTSTTPAAPTAAAQQKATQAASKVLGSSSVKTAAPTVKQGGACTGGAGCQGGKFTGNFFG